MFKILTDYFLYQLFVGVKRLSVAELNELLEEIETAIKDYSEELVQQLALRDELEFEKEVKNSFISVLIEVQNKQREHKEMAKKKKKLKNGSPQNGKQERGHMPGTVRKFLWLYIQNIFFSLWEVVVLDSVKIPGTPASMPSFADKA